MRELSPFEQNLFRRICTGKGNLANLLDPFLERVRIKFNRKTNQVEIFVETSKATPDEDEIGIVLGIIEKTTEVIITAVSLIKLLEKEGYIFLYTNANDQDVIGEFGQGYTKESSISNSFPDTKISELIIEYCSKEIIVTEEARAYLDNGFITREEKRHRQNQKSTNRNIKISRWAVTIAIVALLGETGFNFYDHLKPTDNSDCHCTEQIHLDLDRSNDNLTKLLEGESREINILEKRDSVTTSFLLTKNSDSLKRKRR